MVFSHVIQGHPGGLFQFSGGGVIIINEQLYLDGNFSIEHICIAWYIL